VPLLFEFKIFLLIIIFLLLLFYFKCTNKQNSIMMQFFLVACTLLIIYFYMGCSHVMIIRDITYIKRKIISPFDISSCKLGIT
jgi:hypothetical protein